ncbi:MAG: hypothetical protein MZV65_19865 [Chromatiales bacterium]|nr:hypothetical protein [Chromatiales bacterium]
MTPVAACACGKPPDCLGRRVARRGRRLCQRSALDSRRCRAGRRCSSPCAGRTSTATTSSPPPRGAAAPGAALVSRSGGRSDCRRCGWPTPGWRWVDLARAVAARLRPAADRADRQQRQDHAQGDDRRDPARCAGPALATEGNLNNDIGVPLTLLRLRRGTRRTRSSRWAPTIPARSRT